MALEKHSWSRKEGKEADRCLRRQEDKAHAGDREQVSGAAKPRPKVSKPFRIEVNWNLLGLGTKDRWVVWGRYATPARRDQALDQLQRVHPRLSFRLAE